MPIFDFHCKMCNITKEAIVKNHETDVLCPQCNSPMGRLVSSPAFMLKGEGFYSSGTYPNSRKKGPHIPNEIKEMSDVELNRSLGLPDDH